MGKLCLHREERSFLTKNLKIVVNQCFRRAIDIQKYQRSYSDSESTASDSSERILLKMLRANWLKDTGNIFLHLLRSIL